jgi:MFS family permease
MHGPDSSETSLLRVRPFLYLLTTRAASNAANQMLAIAAGWTIYDLTNSPFLLGIVGLVQFMPALCLALIAGHAADYRERRMILRVCYSIEFCVAIGLFALCSLDHPPVALFYPLLFCNAVARTFEGPSLQSMLAGLVPRPLLGRAVATNSMASRISLLLGPTGGGFLYALGAQADFFACGLLVLVAGVASWFLPRQPPAPRGEETTWQSLFGGLAFIWRTKPMLGALSLDLVATLFGGVTALLPIFARDILHIGPWGFGILRSAPALGGLVVAILLSRYQLGRRGGWFMFVGMAVYGVGTTLFAFSENAFLSIFLLFIVGMGDMLSGVTRQTLIQVLAPDDTRGRVLAVNSLSNSTAGQLGMFESGLAAAALGVEGSVIFGGIAVLTTTGLWAYYFPALHQIDWKAQVMGHKAKPGKALS